MAVSKVSKKRRNWPFILLKTSDLLFTAGAISLNQCCHHHWCSLVSGFNLACRLVFVEIIRNVICDPRIQEAKNWGQCLFQNRSFWSVKQWRISSQSRLLQGFSLLFKMEDREEPYTEIECIDFNVFLLPDTFFLKSSSEDGLSLSQIDCQY